MKLLLSFLFVFPAMSQSFGQGLGPDSLSCSRRPASDNLGGQVEEIMSLVNTPTCGGKPFRPKILDKSFHGISDPRGAFKKGKKAWGSREDIEALKKMNKEGAFKGKAGSFDGAKFLNKFKIPSPMFRCNLESPISIPTIGHLSARKRVCCDEEILEEEMRYYFANFGGGLTCRAFFGLPYVAEVGLKVGFGVNLIGSVGYEPEMCENEHCGALSLTFNLTSAVYAEALNGAGTIQGGISFLPIVSLKQCIPRDVRAALPPADLSYKYGRFVFLGTVRLGWGFTSNYMKTLVQDENEKHADLPIF